MQNHLNFVHKLQLGKVVFLFFLGVRFFLCVSHLVRLLTLKTLKHSHNGEIVLNGLGIGFTKFKSPEKCPFKSLPKYLRSGYISKWIAVRLHFIWRAIVSDSIKPRALQFSRIAQNPSRFFIKCKYIRNEPKREESMWELREEWNSKIIVTIYVSHWNYGAYCKNRLNAIKLVTYWRLDWFCKAFRKTETSTRMTRTGKEWEIVNRRQETQDKRLTSY